MKLAIFAVLATLTMATSAIAQDTVTSTATPVVAETETETDEPAGITDTALSIITAVCEATFILSDDAQTVCLDPSTGPDTIADGSRLSNRGVGSEFNTLYRQLNG